MSIDDVAPERVAGTRSRGPTTWTTASGSSPFTWKTGAWTIFATSVQYGDERASGGVRREADLVVHDDVDGAARAVAVRAGDMLSVSATMPCPANAASPWRRIGRTFACARRVAERVLLRADHALDDRVDASRWLGFGASETPSFAPAVGATCVPDGAEVVLHVAGALDRLRVHVVLELREDLRHAACRRCSRGR